MNAPAIMEPSSTDTRSMVSIRGEQRVVAVSGYGIHPQPVSTISLRRHDSITKWYTSLDSDDEVVSVARDAYKQAVLFCKQELKRDAEEQKMWLDEHTSASDVLDVVGDAKNKYESRRKKSKLKSGNILSEFSSRVIYYSNVLDVLAQHHPEYVALAWGAMKFLFIATLNHEELITQIAYALSEIGDLLRQVEMLLKLYPVEHMRVAAANLYAQILKFCLKATKWYRRNRVMHVVTAIIKPYKLEFKDVVTQIERYSRRLRDLASTACYAEVRDIHTEVAQIKNITHMRVAPGVEATYLQPNSINGGSVDRLTLPLNLEMIEQYLSSNIPKPEESLRVGGKLRDRRRARGATGCPSLWPSSTLQQWASEPTSSFLQVQGSVVTRDDSKDFALDMVRLALSTNVPVIWVFGSTTDGTSTTATISATDILKSLIQQILHQHPATFTRSSNLHEERFEKCSGLDDWLQLFIAVLNELPRILIVLHANERMAQAVKDLGRCWQELMTQKMRTVVKVMIVTYATKTGALLPPSPPSPAPPSCSSSEEQDNRASYFQLSLDGDRRRPGMGRRASPAATRALRGSRAAQGLGPERLKASLLKWMTMSR